MTPHGPLEVIARFTALLDELGVDYVLGGSMASSFFGEPRSTADADIAVLLDVTSGELLLDRVGSAFYVPYDAARTAIREHGSFNLIATDAGFKIDLFVLGDALLDRDQIERRVHVDVPGVDTGLWVTSPEVQVLRKLGWFRDAGGTSDRQWRDVIGILRVAQPLLDMAYLTSTARRLDLDSLLDSAVAEAYHGGRRSRQPP